MSDTRSRQAWELARRRWMAGVLTCGEDAALSHRSAAALLGIGKEFPGRIDVSVPRRRELSRPGLLIRGRPSLPARDLGVSDGISVTSPVRTLVDLATELPMRLGKQLVNRFEVDFFWPDSGPVVGTDDPLSSPNPLGWSAGRGRATEGGCGQAAL